MLDIFFWNHLYGESLGSLPRRRPKGDSGGMLDECDELSLNIPLTSTWEARAWAAWGVFCRPIFDCSSEQEIKIRSFSKNKERSKITGTSKSFRKYFILRSMPSSKQRAWSDQNQPRATYGSLNSKGAHPLPGICLFWGESCKCLTVGLGVHENPTVEI